MIRLLSCALLCIFVSGTAFGQEAKYPFPQNVTYPYGVVPAKRDTVTKFLKTWYDNWKKKYLQECSGILRPGVDPLTKSLVEAQGFSMIAVAYMGDKDVFDKLYKFYQGKCGSSACGLMNWKVNCTGVESNGSGSATDGDIDVACGLVVASWQWPDGGYEEKLNTLLGNLKKVLVTCGSVTAVYPGCSGGSPWGGCNETDISYYEPAFFRYFAKISGDAVWSKLADDTHTIRDAAANKTTGLVPDWQSTSGTAGAGSRKGYYSFDAIRVPYKQTLDYLWNGNEKALAWCKKISGWAYGVGVDKIKDGYNLDGSANGSNHNMAVVGSLGVSAMANTQEIVDAFANECLKLKDDYWYSGYLGNLYLLALSGNMWNPEIIGKVGAAGQQGSTRISSAPHLTVKTVSPGRIVVTGLPRGSVVTLATLDGRTILMKADRSGNGSLSLDSPVIGHGCHVLRIVSGNNLIHCSRQVSMIH